MPPPFASRHDGPAAAAGSGACLRVRGHGGCAVSPIPVPWLRVAGGARALDGMGPSRTVNSCSSVPLLACAATFLIAAWARASCWMHAHTQGRQGLAAQAPGVDAATTPASAPAAISSHAPPNRIVAPPGLRASPGRPRGHAPVQQRGAGGGAGGRQRATGRNGFTHAWAALGGPGAWTMPGRGGARPQAGTVTGARRAPRLAPLASSPAPRRHQGAAASTRQRSCAVLTRAGGGRRHPCAAAARLPQTCTVLAPPAPTLPPPQAFTQRRNAQLLRNDTAWHVFWCAFGLAAAAKWAALNRASPPAEVLSMLLYTAWSPTILYMTRYRCAPAAGCLVAALWRAGRQLPLCTCAGRRRRRRRRALTRSPPPSPPQTGQGGLVPAPPPHRAHGDALCAHRAE